MSVPVIIIIGGPRPKAARTEESTEQAQQFDVQCQDTELSLTEQAALLRAAADQLDAAQSDADPEA